MATERSPEKITSKDTKAKAREEEPLKLLNVFVVIGYIKYVRRAYYKSTKSFGNDERLLYYKEILAAIYIPQPSRPRLEADARCRS